MKKDLQLPLPMEENKEIIAKIKECGENLMTISQTIELLGVNADERKRIVAILTNHYNSNLYKAYHKSRINTILTIKKGTLELAKMGSQTAMIQAEKYI